MCVCLNDLSPGQKGRVSGLLAVGGMRRRLLDMGLIENTQVECVGRSPGGDPRAYLIRGAVVALRRCDGADVLLYEADAV